MARTKRPRRIDLRRQATLFNSDGDQISVTILDVSRMGFRMEVSEPLRLGEHVTLHERGQNMPAEIKWVLGGEAGGVFLRPPDPMLVQGEVGSSRVTDPGTAGDDRRTQTDRRQADDRRCSEQSGTREDGAERRTGERRQTPGDRRLE